MNSLLRPLLVLFVVLSVITGLLYPLAMTGIGRLLFPNQVAGSLLNDGGHLVGSSLVGQSFTDPKYFWGRLSAIAPKPYDGAASGGSNFGPTNPALLASAKARIDALHAADAANTLPIPVDLVTASASGLDPHISPAAAAYQVQRVARLRSLPPERVRALVASSTEGPQWGVFGQARVNVLELNLALDHLR